MPLPNLGKSGSKYGLLYNVRNASLTKRKQRIDHQDPEESALCYFVVMSEWYNVAWEGCDISVLNLLGPLLKPIESRIQCGRLNFKPNSKTT